MQAFLNSTGAITNLLPAVKTGLELILFHRITNNLRLLQASQQKEKCGADYVHPLEGCGKP